MNPSHKLYWLIGGVVALLIVASVIGRILRARVKDEKAAAVVDNLIARVRAWWWMVGDLRGGVPARPQRDDCDVRVHLVLRAARIPDADADQNRRSPRALGGVLHRDPDSIFADRDKLVRPVFDLHPGLRLPVSAFDLRRWRTTPKASWSAAPRFNGA